MQHSISMSTECIKPCTCCDTHHDVKLIVLTGGPGAGKTAVLETARKMLCQHVVILPEAAGIVFGGGFWRLESKSAKQSAQGAIFYIQKQMQNLVNNEGRWGIGLCDRGTLDGLAYWPESEDSYWKEFKTTREAEYSQYSKIIHLRSPSLEQGYNKDNPIRTESSQAAAQIDERIHKIWKNHPNYSEVKSTESFMDKVNAAFELISAAVPECCKGHFKGL